MTAALEVSINPTLLWSVQSNDPNFAFEVTDEGTVRFLSPDPKDPAKHLEIVVQVRFWDIPDEIGPGLAADSDAN